MFNCVGIPHENRVTGVLFGEGTVAEEHQSAAFVMTDDQTASAVEDNGERTEREIRWTSHPLRNHHRKAVILAVVVIGTALLLYLNTSSVGWALVSVLILALGVHDFLLPTEYRLTDEGVESRLLFYRRRKKWSVLRSYHLDRNGVLLSPFPGRSRLEGFRGIYVRFAGNRESVLDYIKQQLAPTEL